MRRPRGAWIAAVLGGLISIPSAIQALVTVGSNPAYGERVWLGWVALGLAVISTLAPLVMPGRRGAPALTMLLGAMGGALAINLFYISTFYIVGAQLWLIGAVFVLVDVPKAET